jgi:hypothetical protein
MAPKCFFTEENVLRDLECPLSAKFQIIDYAHHKKEGKLTVMEREDTIFTACYND